MLIHPVTSDYIIVVSALILTAELYFNTFTISYFECGLQCHFRSDTTISPPPSHFLTSLVLLPNLTPLETVYRPYRPIHLFRPLRKYSCKIQQSRQPVTMPMTQNGSNSSANFGTYNDYGNVTNGKLIYIELAKTELINTHFSI